MKKIFGLVLFMSLLVQPAFSDQMVKPGTCELIVAARPTLSEAQAYVTREISDTKFTKIFKSQNGWHAISIGALKPSEEQPVMQKWKSSGRIPSDSYCSTGEKYTALFDWRTGEKVEDQSNSDKRVNKPRISDDVLANEIKVRGQNYLGKTTELTACGSSSDKVNVRAGPSARKYKVVSSFLSGQPVQVVDRVTNEAGYDYYRVVYPQVMGGGRLFDDIGFVYHKRISKRCDSNLDEVIARNTAWPVTISSEIDRCQFQIANEETAKYWGRATIDDWRAKDPTWHVLCNETKAKSILVKKYLGYHDDDEKHYFQVHMHGCDAQFSIRHDAENREVVRSWRYDSKCLAEKNKVKSTKIQNSPNIGAGDIFGLVFGAGIEGLAAISGTSSEELLQGMADDDPVCYTIDDDDGRSACLGKPYQTNNKDARNILLGQCYSLSATANDSGLREVCVGVNKQACFGMSNSDHAFACSTCNGSRKWAAVYATGNLLTCYQ